MRGVIAFVTLVCVGMAILYFSRGTNLPSPAVVSSAVTNRAEFRQGVEGPQGRRETSKWPSKMQLFFNPTRLAQDPNYRRLIWQFWLTRNLAISRLHEPQVDRIAAMFQSNGVPAEFLFDVVRTAYSDISEVQTFERFAHEQQESAAERIASIESDPSSAESDKAGLRRHVILMSDFLRSNWLARASNFAAASQEVLKRESGISDPAFYDQLFAIRFTSPATWVSTNIAENEPLFGQ